MQLNQSLQLSGNESEAELKAAKREAFESARNAGVFTALRLIADELGESVAAKYGPKHKFTLSDIAIYHDGYGGYLTVHKGGKKVASDHACDRLFVPGQWVDDLTDSLIEAKRRRSVRESNTAEQQRAQLLAQLTI